MVSEGLREVLQRGDGVGELDGDGVASGFAEHAICGDQVQLSVRSGSGIVYEVRWRASGCPASMAIAALAAEVLRDIPLKDVETVLHEAITARGGLQRHEHHAEKMVVRALHEALGS